MSGIHVFTCNNSFSPTFLLRSIPHTHTFLFLLHFRSFIPIFVLFHHSCGNDLYPHPITIKLLKTSRIPVSHLFSASFTHRFILIKTGSQSVGTNRQSNILPRFYLHAENQCSTEIALQNECKGRRYAWLTQTRKNKSVSAIFFIIIICPNFYCLS